MTDSVKKEEASKATVDSKDLPARPTKLDADKAKEVFGGRQR